MTYVIMCSNGCDFELQKDVICEKNRLDSRNMLNSNKKYLQKEKNCAMLILDYPLIYCSSKTIRPFGVLKLQQFFDVLERHKPSKTIRPFGVLKHFSPDISQGRRSFRSFEDNQALRGIETNQTTTLSLVLVLPSKTISPFGVLKLLLSFRGEQEQCLCNFEDNQALRQGKRI